MPKYVAPDSFDLYTVEDWKRHITMHLKTAAISEMDRIVTDEILGIATGEMQRRMWEAFKQEPCPISNGGTQAVMELSRKFDG